MNPEYQSKYDAVAHAVELWRTETGVGRYVVQMWRHLLWFYGGENVVDGSGALPYVPFDLQACGLNLCADSQLLDIGCLGGYGVFDFSLQRCRENLPVPLVTGVDADAESVALAKYMVDQGVWSGLVSPRFLVANAERLPFETGLFDLVIARLLLPYVDVKLTLSEIGRVLKPGGLALVQLHAPGYYRQQVYNSRRRLRAAIYYFRPLISGFYYRITGRQPGLKNWREMAMTPALLREPVSRLGLHQVLVAGESRRPMVLYRKLG